MKILLIENDATVVHEVCSILAKNRFDTMLATTVEEALTLMSSGSPLQMVIADIEIIGKENFDIVKFLNANYQPNSVPVILCGNSAEKATIVKSIGLGANDFLVKPIKSDVLLRKVNSALGKDKGSILLVDDEKLILDLLARILELEGFETITAQSGPDALTLLKVSKVSLIISDIAMPVMDGFELMAAIKEKFPGIPVLLITGYSKQYRREDALASAADGFITKPFRNLEIIRMVKSFNIQPAKKGLIN